MVGARWKSVFSTSHHGFSLRSLYRKFQVHQPPLSCTVEFSKMMKNILGFLEAHKNESLSSTGPEMLHVDQNYYQGECAPCLLVIEDTDGSVFGALLSTPIRWWQHPHRLFFQTKKCSDNSHLACSAERASTFTGQGKVSSSLAGLVGTSTHGLETTRCSNVEGWW